MNVLCGRCGHAAHEHDPVPILSITRNGMIPGYYRLGRCKYQEQLEHGFFHCWCSEYVPHPRPHLAGLIGWAEAAIV